MVLPLFATRFAAYPGGHPSLFQPATSLLIWHKMFCMRDISYRLIWMKFINMLSMYAQSGTQAIWLMNGCGFNIEPFCSGVCGDHRRPQTLAEICRNMAISCDFMAVAAREKYPGLSFNAIFNLCVFVSFQVSSLWQIRLWYPYTMDTV